MSIGAKEILAMAVEYDTLRTERLAIEKQAEAVKEKETELKRQIMDGLQAAGINSVGDNKKVYALVQKDEPVADDWKALYTHIQQTGEFELLYRRINPAAIKERWENGIKVPGIQKFPSLVLSITKAKGAK
jgi:hypothetical protein